MQLYAALGASLTYISGPAPETGEAWNSALTIAEELDDIGYQLQVLRGLWIYRLSRGECRPGLLLAERFLRLAERTADPGDLVVAERMTGVSLHYLGELSRARHHIEQALRGPLLPVQTSHATRLLLDQQITARALLARTYWLQGFPDLAMQAAEEVVTDAQAIEHGLPLCHALAQAACPIALLAGDLAAAERWVNLLIDHTTKHRLGGWLARGQCFRGILLDMRGDFATGLPLLRDALEALRKTGLVMYFTAFLGELARALGRSGAAKEALATIDEALQRCERDEERWCVAELLRIRGELLAPLNAADAEAQFRRALGWARRQGARSWELRAATSLIQLQPPRYRARETQALLAPIYDRFTEGFATADLLAARALLDVDTRPTIVTG
jgi:predicted ATPase